MYAQINIGRKPLVHPPHLFMNVQPALAALLVRLNKHKQVNCTVVGRPKQFPETNTKQK